MISNVDVHTGVTKFYVDEDFYLKKKVRIFHIYLLLISTGVYNWTDNFNDNVIYNSYNFKILMDLKPMLSSSLFSLLYEVIKSIP